METLRFPGITWYLKIIAETRPITTKTRYAKQNTRKTHNIHDKTHSIPKLPRSQDKKTF